MFMAKVWVEEVQDYVDEDEVKDILKEFKELQGRDVVEIIDELTTKYILEKIKGLNEDFDDLTNELAYYNAKVQNSEELNEYEAQRREFILKLSEWKEKVWKIEEEMERKLSNESSTIVIKKKLWEAYDSELGELFEQVKSLQV